MIKTVGQLPPQFQLPLGYVWTGRILSSKFGGFLASLSHRMRSPFLVFCSFPDDQDTTVFNREKKRIASFQQSFQFLKTYSFCFLRCCQTLGFLLEDRLMRQEVDTKS